MGDALNVVIFFGILIAISVYRAQQKAAALSNNPYARAAVKKGGSMLLSWLFKR